MKYRISDSSKIQNYTQDTVDELSSLLHSFHNLLSTHHITPTLIWPWDVQTRLRSIDSNEYIQSIHENDTLCALMIYRTYSIQSEEGIFGLFSRYYTDITDAENTTLSCPEQIDEHSPLTTILSEKKVAYVNHLESFFPKHGYGRKAITNMQSDPSIDTIVLISTTLSNRKSPTDFYKNLNFKETGYYLIEDPIMVWTDPTKYA
jgi:hypothetical protein